LVQVGAKLDERHAGLARVKERLLDHVAVQVLNPELPMPVVCLKGPEGGWDDIVGPLPCWGSRSRVDCAELVDAGALLRERLNVVEVPGYLPEKKAVIAVEHLLPGRAAEPRKMRSRVARGRPDEGIGPSWVHANAGRYGVDAAVDLHAHMQSAAEPKHGPSAGVVLGMHVASAAISRDRSYYLTLYPLVQV